MKLALFLAAGWAYNHVSILCSTIVGLRPDIFEYYHAKISLYSWNRDVYATIYPGDHATRRDISSIFLQYFALFTFMVGKILDMLPSLNSSGAWMGFLNKSTFHGGRVFLFQWHKCRGFS